VTQLEVQLNLIEVERPDVFERPVSLQRVRREPALETIVVRGFRQGCGGAEKGETARNPGCRAQRWVVEVLDEQVPQG